MNVGSILQAYFIFCCLFMLVSSSIIKCHNYLVTAMQESLSSMYLLIDPTKEIYRLEPIGQGRYGKVFAGTDKLNNRKVALKYVENDDRETWKKEIANLEQFDHPNVLKYYGYIEDREKGTNKLRGVYIMTEFVDGTIISSYIKKNEKGGFKGLTEALTHKLFSQLLEGYDQIHSKNLLHRDIKPQNILVDANENIKIIDLGQSEQKVLTRTVRQGTPLYSAPETFHKSPPSDFRSDVWSLGLVLYEMVTGQFPFEDWKNSNDEDAFRRHLEKYAFEFKFPKNFSTVWTSICRRMLHKDYKKRINLHQIIFQLKKRQAEFDKKFTRINPSDSTPKLLIHTGMSGTTDPVAQSADEFQINRAKKYLTFYSTKHKFLVLLKDHLCKFSYPFLSNAHKLVLVFVSYYIYIAAMDELLVQLKDRKIVITGNQVFDASHYEEPYQTEMNNSINLYKDYYTKESRLTKDIIMGRIIPKFELYDEKSVSGETNSVAQSANSVSSKVVEPQELLQKFPKIKELIQNFKQGSNFSKAHYMEIYRELLKNSDYFHPKRSLEKYLYQEDLVVYYLILIIGNLDVILKWGKDVEGNVMEKLRQELFDMTRQDDEIKELIEKIVDLQDKL